MSEQQGYTKKGTPIPSQETCNYIKRLNQDIQVNGQDSVLERKLEEIYSKDPSLYAYIIEVSGRFSEQDETDKRVALAMATTYELVQLQKQERAVKRSRKHITKSL